MSPSPLEYRTAEFAVQATTGGAFRSCDGQNQKATPTRRPFCQTTLQAFLTSPWFRMNFFGMKSAPCTSMQASPALRSTISQPIAGLFRSAKIIPFWALVPQAEHDETFFCPACHASQRSPDSGDYYTCAGVAKANISRAKICDLAAYSKSAFLDDLKIELP
jgi:hypothetical protein